MFQNKIYKHINNRDVAFYIISSNDTEKGIYVIGYWINIYLSKPQIIMAEDGPVTFLIKKEHISNWELYEKNIL